MAEVVEKIVEGTNKSKKYYERQTSVRRVVSHQQCAECVIEQ